MNRRCLTPCSSMSVETCEPNRATSDGRQCLRSWIFQRERGASSSLWPLPDLIPPCRQRIIFSMTCRHVSSSRSPHWIDAGSQLHRQPYPSPILMISFVKPSSRWMALLALLNLGILAPLQIIIAAPAKPNVVYILSDDVGWGDLSVHGGGVPTPNIDRLFARGVELTQFMGWCVCSPTRAMLLTGRHPIRVGTGPETGGELDPAKRPSPKASRPTAIAPASSANGTTATIPTRRNSALPLPRRSSTCRTRNSSAATASTRTASTRRGSITAAARTTSTAAPSRAPARSPGGTTGSSARRTKATPTIWSRSTPSSSFARTRTGRSSATCPSTSPTRRFRPRRTTWPPSIRRWPPSCPPPARKRPTRSKHIHAAMLHAMDKNVAAILAELDKLGLSDNTILVFTSDNGAMEAGSSLPLRGHKHTIYDGGVRLPTVIHWPKGGLVGGKKWDGLCGALDMFPTLMAMTGFEDARRRARWTARTSGPPCATTSPVRSKATTGSGATRTRSAPTSGSSTASSTATNSTTSPRTRPRRTTSPTRIPTWSSHSPRRWTPGPIRWASRSATSPRPRSITPPPRPKARCLPSP